MKTMTNISACIISLSIIFATTSGFAENNLHKSFKVKPGDNLSVKIMGEISVQVWDKDEIDITVSGVDDEDDSGIKINQSDNMISVALDGNGKSCGDCSYAINVPKVTNISLSTVGGDIRIGGQLTGTIKANTMGGEIKMTTCNGNVELTTAGGDIVSGNINGDAKFRTAGGEIRIGNIAGEAEVSTASGDVVIGNVSKSANISTAGGNIRAGNIGNEIKASTMGGDVYIGKTGGKVKISSAGGDIHIDGTSAYAKIATAGGDIKLNNVHGAVNASTAGGDIQAQLFPEGSEESKLVSAVGKITLSLPVNVKVTVQTEIKGWMTDNSSGKVTSDFVNESTTSTREGRKGQKTIQINGGGSLIQVHTVNSDIEIKKIAQ